MATADPAARRRAVILLLSCTAVGALLIFGFGRYREAMLDWVVADPSDTRRRVSLIFFVSAGLFAAPLLFFAGYLWSFGNKVVRAESFPPPGHRVIADTPSLAGAEAVQRGRTFKNLAFFLGAGALVLWFLMWRLAGMFAGRSA
jgi:hypothetical protein